MTHRSRTAPTPQHVSPPLNDQESSVRERTPTPAFTAQPPGRKSDPSFTLDQRLVSKLAEAAAMLAKLEPQDARARLLHIAMLRRDEALLDGILAELALPPRTTRRPR
jgi:hypothetical protein